MFDNGNERASVDEKYQVAGNTSDLTVEADRGGAGDVMIAAGWNPSRIGMALLRLHSEWDGAAKPRRPSKQVIDAKVAELKAADALARSRKARVPDGSPAERAHAYFDRQMASDLRLLAQGLKSRPTLWLQLGPWIAQKGIDPEIAAEGLLHWLDPNCPKCEGHGFFKVPNQPAIGARRCKCNGGHKWEPNHAGRFIAHLDYCVGVARGSLKQRLRPG